MNKLDEICKEIRLLNAIPNDEEAFDCCIKLYNTIIHEPLLLQHAEDSYYIGFSLVAILELNISDDIDINSCNQDFINIKLIGINTINNASFMFHECNLLYSLPNISQWNVSNIIFMILNKKYLFILK